MSNLGKLSDLNTDYTAEAIAGLKKFISERIKSVSEMKSKHKKDTEEFKADEIAKSGYIEALQHVMQAINGAGL